MSAPTAPLEESHHLRTAVLREMATGLGLVSSFQLTPNIAFWGAYSSTYPWVHDRFVANGSGSVLVDIHPNNSAALRNALVNGDLFFNGQFTRGANGGVSPKLSRLQSWFVLGNPQYLDEATYPAGTANALLTQTLTAGEVIHEPGPIAIAMLRDIGWKVARRAAPHADFDGDAASDVAIFRPSNGTWFFRYSSGGTGGVQWGTANDIPVPGDYDGDGRSDIAVYRPSTGHWFLTRSSTNNVSWDTISGCRRRHSCTG